METMTLDIPDELAKQLRPIADRLPRILELGLREFNASNEGGFQGAADVYDFLANLPTPKEIIALRPASSLQNRVQELLQKNREGQLSPEEELEWQQYEYLEHLVRIAKARALQKNLLT